MYFQLWNIKEVEYRVMLLIQQDEILFMMCVSLNFNHDM